MLKLNDKKCLFYDFFLSKPFKIIVIKGKNTLICHKIIHRI